MLEIEQETIEFFEERVYTLGRNIEEKKTYRKHKQ